MIQQDITHSHTAPLCQCGRKAHLIRCRGRAAHDSRLFGLPAVQFHVECMHCSITTPPFTGVGLALNAWRKGNTVATREMPAMRVALDLARLTTGAVA